jgi:hypothetical protein
LENEFIKLIFEAIFLGFGLCSMLVFILSIIRNSEFKRYLNRYFYYTTFLIRILGVFYLIYYAITLQQYFKYEDSSTYLKRATGPYSWAYWYMLLRPIIYTALSQLFWIKKLRKKNIISFLLVLLILIIVICSGPNLERFTIFVTSIHRDYLPYGNGYSSNDWASIIDISLTILLVPLYMLLSFKYILIFTSLVCFTWFIDKKITHKNS